ETATVYEVPKPQERSLTVEWQDPAESAARLPGLSGLEAMQAIASGEIPPAPIALLLGMTMESIEKGRVVFGAEPGEQHYNPIGSVHGGLAATLIDSVTGCAVHTTLPPGKGYATVDLNVTFDRPITRETGKMLCEATIVNAGSKIVTSDARLTAEATGKLLA